MVKLNNELKSLSKNQSWLYQKIMKLGKTKKVVEMSYDDLFDVLDRVKFCYFLDYMRRNKKIKLIKKKMEIKKKATGNICHYETEGKKFYCHYKKGFSCNKCIKLIKGERKS